MKGKVSYCFELLKVEWNVTKDPRLALKMAASGMLALSPAEMFSITLLVSLVVCISLPCQFQPALWSKIEFRDMKSG